MSEPYSLEKFGLMVYAKWKAVPRKDGERVTFKRLDTMIQQLQLLSYPYDNGIPFIICGPSKSPAAPAASMATTVKSTNDHVVALITTILNTSKSLSTREECNYAKTPLMDMIFSMNAHLPLQKFQKANVNSFSSGSKMSKEDLEDDDDDDDEEEGAPKVSCPEDESLVIVCVSPPPNFCSVLAKSDKDGIEFSADINKMKSVYLQNFFF